MKSNETLLQALNRVCLGKLGWHDTPSRSHYIVDPTDNTLWDLKPVLGLVFEILFDEVRKGTPKKLISLCRQNDIDFEFIVFRKAMSRPLGLRLGDQSFSPADWSDLIEPEREVRRGANYYLTKQYHRDPHVVTLALKKANGTCQACRKPAPFKSLKGEPFLEVHHIVPLSRGGIDIIENVVALCPNCHRKQHVGQPDSLV